MQSLEAKKNYRHSFHCAARILSEEGVLRFWSGATPRLGEFNRIIPTLHLADANCSATCTFWRYCVHCCTFFSLSQLSLADVTYVSQYEYVSEFTWQNALTAALQQKIHSTAWRQSNLKWKTALECNFLIYKKLLPYSLLSSRFFRAKTNGLYPFHVNSLLTSSFSLFQALRIIQPNKSHIVCFRYSRSFASLASQFKS